MGEQEVLLYDEYGHEIEVAPAPPVFTWRFFIPLLVAGMGLMFAAGRQTRLATSTTAIEIHAGGRVVTEFDSPVTYQEAKVPTDHPPAHVDVDGEEYTFHYTRRSELLQHFATAQTWVDDKIIWLPTDEDGRTIRESVLHELMHVALHKSGGEYAHPIMADSGDGEPVINPTARMLLNILRDNPALVRWIQRKN
jgi:hypothetical protein